MLPRSTARRSAALAAGVALSLAAAGGMTAVAAPSTAPTGGGTATDVSTDSTSPRGGVDRERAVLQLSLAPLATSTAVDRGKSGRVDLDGAKTKNERARLSAQRNELKKWLRANAPAAKVTGEFDVAVNAVAVTTGGTSLDVLRSAPGVVSASYQGIYVPLGHDDPDLELIAASAGWAAAGAAGGADAGEGVKVAVVDSGIDQSHACFDGENLAPKDNNPYTAGRVSYAEVFHMRAGNRGLTPEAVDSHGTHVAGTIGCDLHTPAVLNGVAVPYAVSGVAPAAELGNFNVFPGDVASARSEDILDALDAAYEWGADVANMSLGGGASGIQDLLTIAVDNLDAADVVVAVANGNSGPGRYTVGSPGSAARALSAGASTVGHFIGAPISVGDLEGGGAAGDFAVVEEGALTAPLGVVAGTTNGLSMACTPLLEESLTGKVALVSRGGCTFGTKIGYAEAAGAVATLVVNNVAGDPTAMGGDPAAPKPSENPAYMVSLDFGKALAQRPGQETTIGSELSYIRSENDNIMAGFSSQGPTDVDLRVKPDVVAPGVNVISSFPNGLGVDGKPYCKDEGAGCWGQISGTSMATPHLAGMAAVVRQAHGGWTAEEVRAAIVGSAQGGVLTSHVDGTTVVPDVQVVGTGLAQLDDAVNATVGVVPVSTSFGAVPAGSGQVLEREVRLVSLDGKAHTVELSLERAVGEGFSVVTTKVDVPADGTATAVLRFEAGKGAAAGERDDYLVVSDGGKTLARSAVFALVK